MFGLLLQAVPKASSEGFSTIEKAKEVVEGSEVFTAGSTLAGGIASIFLLFVIFFYVTSILDGGKFQVKMLMPVLLYILVCNFDWVIGPVTGFTGAIQSSLCSTFNNQTTQVIIDHGGEPGDGIYDIFKKRRSEEFELNEEKAKAEKDVNDKLEVEVAGFERDSTYLHGKVNSEKVLKERTRFVERISDAVRKAVLRMCGEAADEFSMQTGGQALSTALKYSIMGLITSILSWVANIMQQVLTFFAGTMTGIILAFGPLTWAFAVFPGRGKTIETWFIRLCQFSLWSPIVGLIKLLTTTASINLADSLLAQAGGGDGGLFGVCVVLITQIVALTSVPSISQMVLEGASGNVSLTGGLQMAAHAITTTLAPIKTLGGTAITLSNLTANHSQTKQTKQDRKSREALDSKLDQIIQGQNSHSSSN